MLQAATPAPATRCPPLGSQHASASSPRMRLIARRLPWAVLGTTSTRRVQVADLVQNCCCLLMPLQRASPAAQPPPLPPAGCLSWLLLRGRPPRAPAQPAAAHVLRAAEGLPVAAAASRAAAAPQLPAAARLAGLHQAARLRGLCRERPGWLGCSRRPAPGRAAHTPRLPPSSAAVGCCIPALPPPSPAGVLQLHAAADAGRSDAAAAPAAAPGAAAGQHRGGICLLRAAVA
jgi:hypothetical protein